MRRRIIQLLTAMIAVVVVILTVSGTVAHFTSSEATRNTITTSGLRISLLDGDQAYAAPNGIMPGDTITGSPQVANVDEQAAYVRMALIVTARLSDGSTVTLPSSLMQPNYNTTAWQAGGDGFYYYKTALAPGAKTEVLFSQVTFASAIDNTYKDATLTMTIKAQAVQVANNGDNVNEAKGWPED